ncbi:hypothetical protein [Actinomadura sp. DC4]|uniref:hypothetical protein n=1 Tax=Actinomadura sp. DC4 TaxID=3055069 RepID=UPI0025AFD069|nr:hypothetical protein [Actinomadura sp. DC4]MDN3352587.1 hypothetical protein [Actinomadura sp. DC4]
MGDPTTRSLSWPKAAAIVAGVGVAAGLALAAPVRAASPSTAASRIVHHQKPDGTPKKHEPVRRR